MVGGPDDRPASEWLYAAFRPPMEARRAAAAELLAHETGPRGGNRMMVFNRHLGIRNGLGYFLLERDDGGWYLAAFASSVPGHRSSLVVFRELIRASDWLQALVEADAGSDTLPEAS
jgi:hypothetical protein